MILIVHTSSREAGMADQLGRPEYSYRFVLREFRPLLEELGLVIEIVDPLAEVDGIYASAMRRGEPCLFLCFLPPNKVPLGLRCPTVPVFAWEYARLPDEAFGGKPRNDWRRMLSYFGAALTHSRFTVERTRSALAQPDFDIQSVPAPLWDRVRALALPSWRAGATIDLPLPADALVIDSATTDLAFYRKERPDDVPPALRADSCLDHQGHLPLGGVIYTAIFNPGDGRKNWQEMISGFCAALRHQADATLVLKLSHYDPAPIIPEMLEILYKMGPLRCRVLLLHAYLDDAAYASLIRASTYTLNASHGEGQCLPLMEYMSAGRPALAPRHTSMGDYVDPDCAFVIDASLEPGTWPHDQRQAFRTLRYRIHYQSLLMAFQRSYHVACHEPATYEAMSHAAVASLQRYCSHATVKPRLKQFIARRLQTSAAAAQVE